MSSSSQLTLLYDVWTLANTTERVLAAVLAPLQVTPGDFAIYSLLAVQGPLTPTEIARMTGSPATSLTYSLRRAERRGHFAKEPRAGDKRSYHVALTPSGRRLHGDAAKHFAVVMRHVERELPNDGELVRAALQDLREALESALP